MEKTLKRKIRKYANKKYIIKKETLKDRIKYFFSKPKIFIQNYKYSDNKIKFLLKTFLKSKLIIVLLVLLLWIKTIYFYSLTISEASLSKFNITGLDGDYNYDVLNEQIEGINFFDYTSLITIITLSISVLPLLFIKKDKNRFKRSDDI